MSVIPRRPKTEAIAVVAPRRMFMVGRKRRSTPFTFTFGVVVAGLLVFVAVTAPLLGLPNPRSTDLVARLLPPFSEGHLLGTDQLGRDILSRTVAGAQWSLGIGLSAMTIGLILGIAIGVGAAWSRPLVSAVLTRVIDVGMSFPYLVIAITIIAVLGRSFWTLALTLGLVCWPPVARVLFAETLGLREREYVVAARLVGLRPAAVIATHVLPALRPTILVMAAFIFAEMMISESGMSFLGLGAPLGDPTWGNALSESRAYLAVAPWMMFVPATAIVLAVVSANFIGDGLTVRSALRESRTE